MSPLRPELVAFLEQVGLPPTEESIGRLNGAGVAAYQQGRYEDATAFLAAGAELGAALRGPEHPDTLTSMGNLAETLRARGDLAGAEDLQRRVLEARTRVLGAEHPGTLTSMNNLASTLWARGDLAGAEELFSAALAIAEKHRASVGGHVDRGRMAEALGLPVLGTVLAALRIGLGRSAGEVLDALERTAGRSVLDLVTAGKPLERLAREAFGDQPERLRAFEAAWQEAEEADRALVRAKEAGDDRMAAAARARGDAAGAKVNQFARELVPAARPQSINSIRTLLVPGEAVVVYGWSWLAVVAMVVPHAGLGEPIAAVVSEDREFIEQMGALVWGVEEALLGGLRIQQIGELMGALGGILLPEPLRDVVSRASSVKVAPSGPLHRMPLGLLAELGGMEALRRKPITYVPSASMLVVLRERGQERVNRRGGLDLAIIGDPDVADGTPERAGRAVTEDEEVAERFRGEFDPEEAERGRGSLPAARAEAHQVAELVRNNAAANVRLLVGAAATPAAVRSAVHGCDLLHFAVHGWDGGLRKSTDQAPDSGRAQDGDRDPLHSAIVLAPDSGASGEAGCITLREIMADWSPLLERCELAMLPACNLARGVQIGDSMMAMPVGFLHAGARAVVASARSVGDVPTWMLMRRIYESMFGTFSEERTVWGGRERFVGGMRMPLAAALAEAQQWLSGFRTRDELAAWLDAHSVTAGMEEPDRVRHTRAISYFLNTLPEERPLAHPRHWGKFMIYGDLGVLTGRSENAA